jgi:hypothetical protein
MSLSACHCLLQLKKYAQNDNKLGGLLSCSTTKAKQPNMMMSRDLGLLSSSAPKEKKQGDDNKLPNLSHFLQLKKKI